jgi:uncharacterized lipoprotein NlpE involved in copper resistance
MQGKGHLMLILVAFFVFGSCSQNQKTVSSELKPIQAKEQDYKTDIHNSSISLDWAGTYFGTIPCADCEGIKTELTLKKDKTYLLKASYLGEDIQLIEESGTFSWNMAGNMITLSGVKNKPNQYFVGENKLIQLDMEGNRITGSLAKNYVLNKQ